MSIGQFLCRKFCLAIFFVTNSIDGVGDQQIVSKPFGTFKRGFRSSRNFGAAFPVLTEEFADWNAGIRVNRLGRWAENLGIGGGAEKNATARCHENRRANHFVSLSVPMRANAFANKPFVSAKSASEAIIVLALECLHYQL